MKCADFDEKMSLMLDGETGEAETRQIQSHLADCQNCREEFHLRQRTRKLLRNQPPILPNSSFDNKMLRAFKNHGRKPAQKSGGVSWFNFSNPFLKYGLTTAVFILGFGAAFLSGRMSVSPANDSAVSQIENKETGRSEKQTRSSADSIPNNSTAPVNTETKIITRYVEVPVVKEKIVEKKVYVTKTIKSFTQPPAAIFAKTKIEEGREKIAEQFNLKDLQPVSTISYKIIRKGDNNE